MPRPIGGMSVSTRVPQAGGNYRVTGRTPPSGVPGRAAEQRQNPDRRWYRPPAGDRNFDGVPRTDLTHRPHH